MNWKLPAALAASLIVPALAPAPAAAEEGFFSRLGAALDRGVVRGKELVAEGAEGAGRGLQQAGDATRSAAERVARRLRERNGDSPPEADAPRQ